MWAYQLILNLITIPGTFAMSFTLYIHRYRLSILEIHVHLQVIGMQLVQISMQELPFIYLMHTFSPLLREIAIKSSILKYITLSHIYR